MRTKNVLDMLLAQAKQKLEEIKQLQFFGGDALNLKRYVVDIIIPADARTHCWRIVMMPENKDTTMPIGVIVKPGKPTQSKIYTEIERVKRDDGNFEYLLISNENYDTDAVVDTIAITYSGKANFTINRIG